MKWKKIKDRCWELTIEDGRKFYGTNKKECLKSLEENFLKKFLGELK